MTADSFEHRDGPEAVAPSEVVRERKPKARAPHAAPFAARGWVALTAERNASVHTVRNYRIDLLDYLRWAHRVRLDPLRVTHKQLRGYLGELDQARYARSTINRRLSSLRALFRWLTRPIDASWGRLGRRPRGALPLGHGYVVVLAIPEVPLVELLLKKLEGGLHPLAVVAPLHV